MPSPSPDIDMGKLKFFQKNNDTLKFKMLSLQIEISEAIFPKKSLSVHMFLFMSCPVPKKSLKPKIMLNKVVGYTLESDKKHSESYCGSGGRGRSDI